MMKGLRKATLAVKWPRIRTALELNDHVECITVYVHGFYQVQDRDEQDVVALVEFNGKLTDVSPSLLTFITPISHHVVWDSEGIESVALNVEPLCKPSVPRQVTIKTFTGTTYPRDEMQLCIADWFEKYEEKAPKLDYVDSQFVRNENSYREPEYIWVVALYLSKEE